MNALQAYFEETGDTPTALANRIGRAPSSVIRVMRGERGASGTLAREISAATGGKVTAADIRVLVLQETAIVSGRAA